MSYDVKNAFEAENLIKWTLAQHEGFVSPDCSIEVPFFAIFLSDNRFNMGLIGNSRCNSEELT